MKSEYVYGTENGEFDCLDGSSEECNVFLNNINVLTTLYMQRIDLVISLILRIIMIEEFNVSKALLSFHCNAHSHIDFKNRKDMHIDLLKKSQY